MFARNTPTRMKGSGVVQSLKSWASKLHPQLPLNQKESQRLLTALTSSFRQQLDKAHPSKVSGDDAKPAQGTAAGPRAGIRDFRASSIVSADRHLASVLTNPLLAKSSGSAGPALNYSSAERDFKEDPSQDTITLLEEYHKHGAATIPIAALCLEQFNSHIAGLSGLERQKTIIEKQAGRRTLAWLLKSGLHDTDDFVDDGRLRKVMVPLLCEEGHEELLWEWLAMDLRLGSQRHPKGYPETHVKQRLHEYRWRAVVIRDMVRTKLSATRNNCADAALDALFRASNLHKQGATLSLQPPREPLNKAFTRSPYLWRNTDPVKFNRMLELVLQSSSIGYPAFEWASLGLSHPKTPVGIPMLDILHGIFDAEARGPGLNMRIHMTEPRRNRAKARAHFHRLLLRTAVLLRRDGLTTDAAWVLSLAKRIYPEFEDVVESCMKQESDHFGAVSKQNSTTQDKESSITAPLPAFS